MTRGDAIGLTLVLVAGLGGSAWMVQKGRALGRSTPPREAPDPVAALASEPSHRVSASPRPAKPVPTGVDPRWSELNRQAIAALDAGDPERAIALFEQCVEAVPDEPVFRANLAEALTRLATRRYEARETRAEAIEELARAVELAPDRHELADLLAQWRKLAEAEKGFWTDESEHFQLTYDGERSELLNRGYDQLLTELESAYLEFGELFGRFPVEGGRPKIQVVLYGRDAFSELTGIGHWAGGVYDGSVRLPLEDFDRDRAEIERVLRHELVHAFVTAIGGRSVPGWLNEGLAQWLEPAFLDERASHVEAARRTLDAGTLFPLEKLAGSLAKGQDEAEIRRAYAESLALVGFIARYYGERVLFDLVGGCADGRSCSDTFRERTGVELGGVLEDLARGL